MLRPGYDVDIIAEELGYEGPEFAQRTGPDTVGISARRRRKKARVKAKRRARRKRRQRRLKKAMKKFAKFSTAPLRAAGKLVKGLIPGAKGGGGQAAPVASQAAYGPRGRRAGATVAYQRPPIIVRF